VTQDVTEYREVGALRLRADGALAWILVTTGPYREVDAVESDATEATPLAYSRGVNPPFVLRFDETSVHWSEDGVDRNAPVR
jgi:hypothetical protein